jgi:hypothetical protein
MQIFSPKMRCSRAISARAAASPFFMDLLAYIKRMGGYRMAREM